MNDELFIGLVKQLNEARTDFTEKEKAVKEMDAEFAPKFEALSLERSLLEAQIKAVVLEAGQSIKGTHHHFTWSKPRVSWDTKALDGYAKAHPEITQFRREGDPSVSVRKVTA